jgi:hypothetical protein
LIAEYCGCSIEWKVRFVYGGFWCPFDDELFGGFEGKTMRVER